jgi:hypothetical protein
VDTPVGATLNDDQLSGRMKSCLKDLLGIYAGKPKVFSASRDSLAHKKTRRLSSTGSFGFGVAATLLQPNPYRSVN